MKLERVVNMMDLICVSLAVTALLGLALLYHIWIKVTPEESLASAIMTILLLVYGTGLLGNTGISLYIVYVLAALGILGAFVVFLKGRKIRRESNQKLCSIATFFTPGIVMYLCLVFLIWFAFRGFIVSNWDELYQWGKAAQYMVLHDALPVGIDFKGESELLSTTTFFHYFIAKMGVLLRGSVTESHYYVSNVLLWFAAVLLPLSGTGWKDWFRVSVYGVVQFLLAALLFVQPYYNIYTDQPVCYWAGALIAWLLLERCKKSNWYLIPLILINVFKMKNMVGPLFVGIVLGALLILYGIQENVREKNGIWWKVWNVVFSGKILVVFGVLGAGCLALVNYRLATLIIPGEENRYTLTVQAMFSKLFAAVNKHNDNLYLSYGSFLVFVALIVVFLYPIILNGLEKKRFRMLMSVYMAGFVVFWFIMLYAYMRVFVYADSIQATSLERYYSDYMMLGIIPLLIPFFFSGRNGVESERKKKIKIFTRYGVIGFVILYTVVGIHSYFLPQLVHSQATKQKRFARREMVREYVEEIDELTNGVGNVYFINQKASDLYTLAADYDLGDRFTRGEICFRFRKNSDEYVAALREYPPEQMPTVLFEQSFSYVWVYSSNKYLRESMQQVFDIEKVKKGDFYRVVIQRGGRLTLEYVCNLEQRVSQ